MDYSSSSLYSHIFIKSVIFFCVVYCYQESRCKQDVRDQFDDKVQTCQSGQHYGERRSEEDDQAKEQRSGIVNLEGLDLEIAQRIIDFTSGAAFAIDGKLQKISSYIFLVTPPNVEISGDLQDLLGGGSLTTSPVSRF
ncbi:MAG: cell division protein SepF [Erysipelotrichaceae bacterium]|nr:cell division protein SepF [Erysipelotrichaceae bacterium]